MGVTAVTIWSEGVRMAGDLHVPDDLKAGEKRPAIVLCHGWAGAKEHLSRAYAPVFCAAGFVCLTFDYRGWHESDARLLILDEQGEPDADGVIQVRAKPIRDVVDPLDQNRDIHNAIDFLLGEPSVDPERLGLWGTSFGGGHVVKIAGMDPRVKAVVSQVPGMGQPADERGFMQPGPYGQRIASALARGEMEMVPRPENLAPSLKGKADSRTMWLHRPRQAAANIRVPILLIDQEEEEYGGRENSGLAAKEALPADTVIEYHVFPGKHYDVYGDNLEKGVSMATEWFRKYL